MRAAVAATAETSYVYVTTKSKPEGRELQRVIIAVADKARHQAAFHAARAAAEGIEYARELGNLPPNHATPTRLGEEARKLAKAHGFQCEVLGPKEIAKAGMGSFLAVAQGSEQPPRFIVLRYQGGGRGRRAAGAGGQGHHLRQRRHLDQAVAGHGRDEVRHGRRGQRAGRLPGPGRPAARPQRDRPHPQLREHARRALGQAGRHRHQHERPDHRDPQHRRRGPPDPVRCADLCRAVQAARRDRHRDPDRRLRGGPGRRAQRPVRLRRRPGASPAGGRRRGAGPVLAHAAGRRIRRGAEEQLRRRGQRRGPRRRRRERRQVPAALCRKVSLGASGHRRHRLEGRRRQGLHRPTRWACWCSSCWTARRRRRRGGAAPLRDASRAA